MSNPTPNIAANTGSTPAQSPAWKVANEVVINAAVAERLQLAREQHTHKAVLDVVLERCTAGVDLRQQPPLPVITRAGMRRESSAHADYAGLGLSWTIGEVDLRKQPRPRVIASANNTP